MGSHKQRVQRKIKKEVKRKAQAKRSQQQRTDVMSDMMKMMMLMKTGQNPSTEDANKVLTAKEIVAKAEAEEKRKQRELKAQYDDIKANAEVDKIKSKTQYMDKKMKHMLKQQEAQKELDDIRAKLKAAKDETEVLKLKQKADIARDKLEYERRTLDLMLQGQNLTDEQMAKQAEVRSLKQRYKEQQMMLDQKQKEHDIEALEQERKATLDKIEDATARIEKFLKLTDRSGKTYKNVLLDAINYTDFLEKGVLDQLVEIADIKDQNKTLSRASLGPKLRNAKKAHSELAIALRDLKAGNEHLNGLNDMLRVETNENEKLKREIATIQHANNALGRVSRVNPKTGELQYRIKVRKTVTEDDDEGNQQTRTNLVNRWKDADQIDYDKDVLVERDIADELAKAEHEKQVLTSTKTQLQNKYDRNERDVLRVDELEHEKNKLKALNNEMGDETYDDLTAEIANLERQIKEYQEKINDEQLSKAEHNKYVRETTELLNKKAALEHELGNIKTKTIDDELIKARADAVNAIAETESQIKTRRAKNDAVDKFENETAQMDVERKLKQKMLDTMTDKAGDENLKQIGTSRANAELNEKQLAAEEAERNAADALRIATFKQEALNGESVKASQQKIAQAQMARAQHEHEAKEREILYNEQFKARHARINAQVRANLNSSFTSSNSLTEAETLYAAANDAFDRAINDMKDEEDYVHNKNNRIRTRLSDDGALKEQVNQILDGRGYDIENQDWYDHNLRNREETDAFSNFVDKVNAAFDTDKREWDLEKLKDEGDIKEYLDIAGFVPKYKERLIIRNDDD